MEKPHPIERAYIEWSPTSAQRMHAAKKVFPGGDTRASAHFSPYPLVMRKGAGCKVFDIDGHELIDFMNNFTSLIHGHAHAPTVEAIRSQAGLGCALAAPSEGQIALAELIVERVPSLEQMRFCSSGTEATLMAIRCARAATGRQKILKMEGGYHGSYEQAEVSLLPLHNERGSIEEPVSLPVDASIPDSVLKDTVVCPYNQPEMASRLIAANAKQLAAIIVEPILGSLGMISATTEFLTTLREQASLHGIVLIFDEVITLRASAGGVQEVLGIMPDLTAMGKVIGGGLPIGAFGGKTEFMQWFNPERSDAVFHASTFSGNALSMAAGYAALTHFDVNVVSHVNRLGEQLRIGINQAFSKHGIKGQATGAYSLMNVILSDKTVRDARDSMDIMSQTNHISQLLHLLLLMHGVVCARRLMFSISSPMTVKDIDSVIELFSSCLLKLKPYIERDCPALLA